MFYDIFAELCAHKGLSVSAAAKEIGIDKSNVSKWKHRGLTPRADALEKIADYFGVTIDYLQGRNLEQEKTTTQGSGENDMSVLLDTSIDMLGQETIMFDGQTLKLSRRGAELLKRSIQNVKDTAAELAEAENEKKRGD